MTYASFELAAQRVRQLVRDLGVWPGIIHTGDGWRLTVDVPDLVTARYFRGIPDPE